MDLFLTVFYPKKKGRHRSDVGSLHSVDMYSTAIFFLDWVLGFWGVWIIITNFDIKHSQCRRQYDHPYSLITCLHQYGRTFIRLDNFGHDM